MHCVAVAMLAVVVRLIADSELDGLAEVVGPIMINHRWTLWKENMALT